ALPIYGASGPTRHFLAPSGSGTRSRSTLTWPSPQTVDGAWPVLAPIFKLCFGSSEPFVGVCDLGDLGVAARRRPPRCARVAIAAAVGHGFEIVTTPQITPSVLGFEARLRVRPR